jgi:hypothetical protein
LHGSERKIDPAGVRKPRPLFRADEARQHPFGRREIGPLRGIGQRSYEVYPTHMFVLFALFDLFVSRGKPMGARWLVPAKLGICNWESRAGRLWPLPVTAPLIS